MNLFFLFSQTTDEAAPADGAVAALAEKQPLLPIFGEGQAAQFQRADREYDEDEERDLENQRYKYVIGEQCMSAKDDYPLIFVLFAVRLEDKLGDGIVEPRSLEVEGIFVGRKPVVPANVVHRAEKRILEECVVENKVFRRKSPVFSRTTLLLF